MRSTECADTAFADMYQYMQDMVHINVMTESIPAWIGNMNIRLHGTKRMIDSLFTYFMF